MRFWPTGRREAHRRGTDDTACGAAIAVPLSETALRAARCPLMSVGALTRVTSDLQQRSGEVVVLSLVEPVPRHLYLREVVSCPLL